MTNKQNTDEMLNLCKGAQNKKDVQGWNTLNQYNNTSSNKQFDVRVYQKGSTIVMAFAGTQYKGINDLRNDSAVYSTKIPSQYGDAQRLYEQIQKDYKGANIEFAGYSLGGTISNLLSHHSGKPSTAFAPIGSKHIADVHPNHFKHDGSSIKTYGVKGDKFFEDFKDKHSGEVFMIDGLPNKKDPISLHYIGNYSTGTFNNAKPVGKPTGGAASIEKSFTAEQIGRMSKEEFAQNEARIMEQLAKGQIKRESEDKDYSDYSNPETGSSKIYSREDIANMSTKEYAQNEKEIMAQMNSPIGVPTQAELETASESGGGTVYVQSYTRADGTEVKGYYRSKGR